MDDMLGLKVTVEIDVDLATWRENYGDEPIPAITNDFVHVIQYLIETNMEQRGIGATVRTSAVAPKRSVRV